MHFFKIISKILALRVSELKILQHSINAVNPNHFQGTISSPIQRNRIKGRSSYFSFTAKWPDSRPFSMTFEHCADFRTHPRRLSDASRGQFGTACTNGLNEQLVSIDSRRLRLVLSLCYGSAAGTAGFPSLFLSFAPTPPFSKRSSCPSPLPISLALEKYVIARAMRFLTQESTGIIYDRNY